MKILVYEDQHYAQLYPLSMMRPVYGIRTGACRLLERIEFIIDKKYEIILNCRESISEYLRELYPNRVNEASNDSYLMLNGRALFTGEHINSILSEKKKNVMYVQGENIIAARIEEDRCEILQNKFQSDTEKILDKGFFDSLSLEKITLTNEIEIFNYPWDTIRILIKDNLKIDFELFLFNNKRFKNFKESSDSTGKGNFFASEGSAFTQIVFDDSEGKIIIDDNVKIEPFTYIKGPVYIGKNSIIKSGSKIYGPCIIGDHSKVSGEIAESIFDSYVNKQHDGFIGHSYICPFVNLGADTVTSDLKNNYSQIKIDGNDTGMMFLGSIIGDHSKTSINTMLNTGTITGIFANIFGGGFPSKSLGSFSWNECGKPSEQYDIDKAIDTATIAMKRRGIRMSNAYEMLVRSYSKI